MKLLCMDAEYLCARAEKNEAEGTVTAYDAENRVVFRAVKVTDFAPYTLTGGDWSAPQPSPQADMDAMLVDHEYRLTLLELDV